MPNPLSAQRIKVSTNQRADFVPCYWKIKTVREPEVTAKVEHSKASVESVKVSLILHLQLCYNQIINERRKKCANKNDHATTRPLTASLCFRMGLGLLSIVSGS